MGIEQRRIIGLELEVCIIVAADAEIYAGGTPFERVGSLACILQRLPGNLEQQALLWIHTMRFTAGDAGLRELRLSFHVGEQPPAVRRLVGEPMLS